MTVGLLKGTVEAEDGSGVERGKTEGEDGATVLEEDMLLCSDVGGDGEVARVLEGEGCSGGGGGDDVELVLLGEVDEDVDDVDSGLPGTVVGRFVCEEVQELLALVVLIEAVEIVDLGAGDDGPGDVGGDGVEELFEVAAVGIGVGEVDVHDKDALELVESPTDEWDEPGAGVVVWKALETERLEKDSLELDDVTANELLGMVEVFDVARPEVVTDALVVDSLKLTDVAVELFKLEVGTDADMLAVVVETPESDVLRPEDGIAGELLEPRMAVGVDEVELLTEIWLVDVPVEVGNTRDGVTVDPVRPGGSIVCDMLVVLASGVKEVMVE